MSMNYLASLVLRLPFATAVAAGCLLATSGIADDDAIQNPLMDDAQSYDFSLKDYDLTTPGESLGLNPGETLADRGQSFYDRNQHQRSSNNPSSSNWQRSQNSQSSDSRDRRSSYDSYYQRNGNSTYRDNDYRNRNNNTNQNNSDSGGGYNQYQYYPYEYERGISRQYQDGRIPYYRSREYPSTYGSRSVEQATSPNAKYYWGGR